MFLLVNSYYDNLNMRGDQEGNHKGYTKLREKDTVLSMLSGLNIKNCTVDYKAMFGVLLHVPVAISKASIASNFSK